MPRRGENIHKRKDGRWEGRFICERDFSGKAKYSSVYGKSYSEVKNKLAEIKCKDNISNYNNQICFGEVLKLWIDRNKVKLKQASVLKYNNLIEKHILPSLGHIPVSKLNSEIINRFIDQKIKNGRLDNKGGLSPSYIRTISNIVSSAMNLAVAENYCRPMKNQIYRPPQKNKNIEIFCEAELKKLESCLYDNTDETKLGIIIALQTGLRIGEICALKWDDFDFNDNLLYVKSTISRVANQTGGTKLIIDSPKTPTSNRIIPISDKLLTILNSVRKISRSEFIISKSKGFTSPRTFEYRFHKILSKCGIRQVNFHTLRHTFATRCLSVGIDVKTLSEILGHSNTTITLNTYVHSSLQIKKREMKKLFPVSA